MLYFTEIIVDLDIILYIVSNVEIQNVFQIDFMMIDITILL